MQENAPTSNQFVVDLLTTLKKDRFSPAGWWHFLVRSWEMSCATANAHPTLKHSWLHTTLLMAILTALTLIITCFTEGVATTLRLLPGFIFCVAWQQSDLFWHLGLNRQVQTGKLLQHIGIANTLTVLRGLGASYLLGRLFGSLSTPSMLALLVFLFGIVTDILDGQLARHTQTQTRLGRIADGEADFCLYLALTLILIQNSVLPLWLGIVMLLRFCVPLLAALISYFLFAHQVHFGSTIWGKYAGVAQSLYFFVLLAPPQLTFIPHIINLPLLIITLVLLILAPAAQILRQNRDQGGSRPLAGFLSLLHLKDEGFIGVGTPFTASAIDRFLLGGDETPTPEGEEAINRGCTDGVEKNTSVAE
jgi:phosphatidylglycerophosphate synthase